MTIVDTDEILFQDLKLLNLAHIKDGDAGESFGIFKAKLANIKFLSWAWGNGKDVPILHDAVVEFCASPTNQTVTNSAWVPYRQT